MDEICFYDLNTEKFTKYINIPNRIYKTDLNFIVKNGIDNNYSYDKTGRLITEVDMDDYSEWERYWLDRCIVFFDGNEIFYSKF
jgi:hypothetical protein